MNTSPADIVLSDREFAEAVEVVAAMAALLIASLSATEAEFRECSSDILRGIIGAPESEMEERARLFACMSGAKNAALSLSRFSLPTTTPTVRGCACGIAFGPIKGEVIAGMIRERFGLAVGNCSGWGNS